MKYLPNLSKNKLLLTTVTSFMMTSTVYAEHKNLSYAEIKSDIIESERSYTLQKRDNLAKQSLEKNRFYVSSIIDQTREKIRAVR